MSSTFRNLTLIALAVLLALLLALALAWNYLSADAQARSPASILAEPWITLGFYEPAVRVPGTIAATARLKSGHNASVATANLETVWDLGGLYAWPPGAVAMTLSSDNANDTAAGSGARSVDVYGLDGAFVELAVQTVALSGLAPVAVPLDLARVNGLRVRAAGLSGQNEGNIYLGTGAVVGGVPAIVYGVIAAPSAVLPGLEVNTDQQCFTSIPANGRATITHVSLAGSDDFNYRLRIRENFGDYAGLWRILLEGDALGAQADPIQEAPLLLPSGADLEIQARSLSGPSIGVGCWIRYTIWRNLP